MAYQHILCAVDLSEESAQVLRKAKDVAASSSARLTLLSVVKPLAQVYGGLDMAPLASGAMSFEAEALTQASAQLGELAEKYDADEFDVVLGAPVYEIHAFASKVAADIIIMGTHGRHGLGLLLGSTASGVLHGATCDVLAVRVETEKAT